MAVRGKEKKTRLWKGGRRRGVGGGMGSGRGEGGGGRKGERKVCDFVLEEGHLKIRRAQKG